MLIDSNRFYSPREIIVANGGILPMSLSAVYAAISSKEIPCRTIGKRKFIPGTYLLEFLNCTSTGNHQDNAQE
jgi:hypothetical protein